MRVFWLISVVFQAALFAGQIGGAGQPGVPGNNTITSAKIVDGTIVNADVNAAAAIVDTKLATIATAGKVSDTALSSNVPLKDTANDFSLTQTVTDGVNSSVVISAGSLAFHNIITGDDLFNIDGSGSPTVAAGVKLGFTSQTTAGAGPEQWFELFSTEYIEVKSGDASARTNLLIGGLARRSRSQDTTADFEIKDYSIITDATAGAVTLTVPVGITIGHELVIKKTDSSTNTVTLSDVSQVIRNQNETITMIKDASGGWRTISYYNGQRIHATAMLNFPDTTVETSNSLTATVTGAAAGDVVSIGVPTAAWNANGIYTAYCNAADTVTIQFSNNNSTILGTSINPAEGSFKITVFKQP